MSLHGFVLPDHASGAARSLAVDVHLLPMPNVYPAGGIDHDMTDALASVTFGVLSLESAGGVVAAGLTPETHPDLPSPGHLLVRLYRITGVNLTELSPGTVLAGLVYRCLALGVPA